MKGAENTPKASKSTKVETVALGLVKELPFFENEVRASGLLDNLQFVRMAQLLLYQLHGHFLEIFG